MADVELFIQETKPPPPRRDHFPKLILTTCILISIILTPILTILYAICFVYKQMVKIYLKIHLGSKFAGFIHGTDVFWSFEDESLGVLNILAIIKSENLSTLLTGLRTKIKNLFTENGKYEKFNYSRENYGGYYYWKRDYFQVNDHIKCLDFGDQLLTKQILIEEVSKNCNKILPKNHKTCWEILVGTKRLEEENAFPILIRLHHSIGDGISLVKVLLNFSSDFQPEIEQKVQIKPKPKLKFFLYMIYLNIMGLAQVLNQALTLPIDVNTLHGPKLTGQKLVAWRSDSDTDQFNTLDLIKSIKLKLSDTYFTDIICTALTDCIFQHFKRNVTEIPEFIHVLAPIQAKEILQMIPDQNELNNSFAPVFFTFPMNLNRNRNQNKPEILLRLEQVKKQIDMVKKSRSIEACYWVLMIIGELLPIPLLNPFSQVHFGTVTISNLIGTEQIINDHFTIQDLVFWTPHRTTLGLGISVLSYDNRLHLGLIVDRALISKQEQAQLILDNFVQTLQKLDQITN